MAVILLHGFTHTGASWDPVRAALGRGYPVATPDLRGHGAASPLGPVSLDAVLADLAPLCREDAVLAGYSMGGRIALHAALTGGARRLVLIGASPGLADPDERAARRAADEALAARLEGMTIEAFAAEWARTPLLADQPTDVRQRVDADRRRSTPAGLAAALRGLGTGALPSLWDRLDELRMPVSLVVGERDAKFRAVAEAMAARLPRASVDVVPGAGHAVHLEAPEAVAAVLRGGFQYP